MTRDSASGQLNGLKEKGTWGEGGRKEGEGGGGGRGGGGHQEGDERGGERARAAASAESAAGGEWAPVQPSYTQVGRV